MAIVIFDPAWIITRLQAEVTELRRVAGSAEFAAAAEDLKQTPTAFVIPASEKPAASGSGTLVVSQYNTVRFYVAVAVQNLRDSRGDKAQGDLIALRTAIMTALHGWQPDTSFDPIEYGGGNLVRFNNQVLWWQDNFFTAHLMRSL